MLINNNYYRKIYVPKQVTGYLLELYFCSGTGGTTGTGGFHVAKCDGVLIYKYISLCISCFI